MYVGGKVNNVDNIDVDLFNVDEVHMFVQDLGYDSKQLIFYHFKLPNKSLDYGLRPLSCDADVVSLINIVETFKVVEVFIEYWLTSVDHHYLSPFKPSVEIKELDDDVKLDASVTVNVDENMNADDEQDRDAENEQDSSEDEQGRGDDRENFIMDEEHVIDEVKVNMEGFTFIVWEQGADPTITPNVDLKNEALEVLDFDSFDSDVGDDTISIRRRNLRKLRKADGQSCGIVNNLFVGQEFLNREVAKDRIKAHAVETRRKC
ncbi:hypothetical protein Tco_0998229 [Tanacetum coccineum]